jgi:ABC transport permease subunit
MGHYTMNASRRAFLRKASSLSLAGAAAPWALNLAALGEAAAQSATDYKALVCVFLYGGNDYANTLVPYDTVHHEQYRVQRAALAHSRTTLGATVLDTMQPALDRYGAADQTPTIMGFAIIRELGPLITAIILAGRSGSAFAAEIGTMKVTEEVNALTTMGLNPERFLVTPRVLAVAITTPLLSVFASFAGVLGGWLPMIARDMSLELYLQNVRNSIDQVDFLQGVFKAFVFAVVIGGIGCRSGLKTQVGPGAVGASTTRAVVAGIVAIIVLDGVLVGLFHALGI